jgi:hypothetical protein
MKIRSGISVAVVLLAGGVVTAEDMKSGPQVGEGISGGFQAQFLNGDQAGNRRCPV